MEGGGTDRPRRNLLLHGVGTPRRELEPGEEEVWIPRPLLTEVLDLAAEFSAPVSIDDGNLSDIEEVLPALLDRGMTATFYVLAGRIDRPGSLTRQAIQQLRDAGMTIASHGMNHVSWRGLTAEQRHDEFVVARQEISEVVGASVTGAACPFGSYDRRALQQLRRCDYEHVATSDGWPCAPAAWLQARYSIRRTTSPDDLARLLASPPSLPERAQFSAKRIWKRLR